MNKAREDIGYTRPTIPDSEKVMERMKRLPRDKHVSPLLEEYCEKHGIKLEGVEPWPKPNK